ncbi:MAG TPA: CdaR family protein [Anaerolineales bacterium]|nr:CdaR family protein [Anaerolineales bacterium]
MRWIAKNFRTFLLSLILAVSVWVSAVTSADPNEVRIYPDPIPLEVVGQDPSLVITSEIPPTVEVSLRAPRSVWEQLTALERSVQATLDLSGLSAGTHEVEIQIRLLVRPAQIVLVNPAFVTVVLEPLSTQTLPVDLSLVGEPAIGYQAGEVSFDPKEVLISGPESIVKQAARARVLVNLDGARESIDQSLAVQIVDENNTQLEGLTLTPAKIQVTVPISQQGGFRDVAVKVVVSGQIAAGYRLENISVFPPVVTVFASNPELVNQLPGVVETMPLDLQGAKENITTRLALNLPKDITIVGAQTVQVTVSISPIQTSLTLLNQPVNVKGLQEGLSAQVLPQSVDVIISGPLPVLDALTPQDIVVSVDVSGLTLGTHQLNPTVEVLVDNVLVESILPGTVEVVLSIPGTPTITPSPTP